MLIDTHLHLLKKDYENIEDVIKRAYAKNVKILILAGTALEDNKESIDIINKKENIFLSIGYHPEIAKEITEKDFTLLEEQIIRNKKKIVAIGEIGLDYHYGVEEKEYQKNIFCRQLDLAKKYDLPVVIHMRDATDDVYEILKKYDLKGVIHCFSEDIEVAKRFIGIGYILGIGGIVTFKNSKLKNVVKEVDLKNIILETDSPYLSPFRGDKNEPENIPLIAKEIANIKNIDSVEIENITTNNAIKLFDLSSKIC